MGRGFGTNNMTEGELKKAKAQRDKKFYDAHRDENKKARALKLLNAKTITCGCGGTYKDIIQNKNSHYSTQKHELYDHEEDNQIRQLILKKVNGVNTIEEAQTKLNEVYFNAECYTITQKTNYVIKLLKRLNKIADKIAKITKIKIKRKLNIIDG